MKLATCGVLAVVTVIATTCIYILVSRPVLAISLKSSTPTRVLLITDPEDVVPPEALQLKTIKTNAKFSDSQNLRLGVAAQSLEATLDNPIRLVRGDLKELTGDTTRDTPYVLLGVYDYKDTVMARVAPSVENWEAIRGRLAHIALNRSQVPVGNNLEVLLQRALSYALGHAIRDTDDSTNIKLCYY